MTCKDNCLFAPLCKYNDGISEWSLSNCPLHKDKSRFIELPCAVGDTVYVLDCAKPYIKERKITRIETTDIGMYLYSFGFGYPDYLIGKKVFLAKSQAEEALNEQKKL